jgi:hypothetical protein
MPAKPPVLVRRPPPGPPNQQEIIRRAEAVARVLDRWVGVPGSNLGFGLDALIGLFLPVVGDFATGFASLYIVVQAIRVKVPAVVIARMLLNIAVDELIGLVPFLGDIGDVFFQSNLKNMKLLRAHAGGGKSTTGDWLVVGTALLVVLALIALPTILLYFLTRNLFQ